MQPPIVVCVRLGKASTHPAVTVILTVNITISLFRLTRGKLRRIAKRWHSRGTGLQDLTRGKAALRGNSNVDGGVHTRLRKRLKNSVKFAMATMGDYL